MVPFDVVDGGAVVTDNEDAAVRMQAVRRLLEPDASLVEQVVSRQAQWESLIFRAERLTVTQPDGIHGLRDVVWHHGGAGVLAIHEGRMCLVRQWRVALGRLTLEIPAGKVDAGEDGAHAAARELAEETGLVADHLTLVAEAAGSPGFTNEMTRIYRAHGLAARQAHPEEDEFVKVAWVEPRAIVEAAAAGIIQDAKTIIAAYAALVEMDGEGHRH